MSERQHPDELEIADMGRRDPRKRRDEELKVVREHPVKEEPKQPK